VANTHASGHIVIGQLIRDYFGKNISEYFAGFWVILSCRFYYSHDSVVELDRRTSRYEH